MRVLAVGLGEPEGPVCLDDGGFYVVEMAASRGAVSRVAPEGGVSTILQSGGRPTGLAVDGAGRIWIAEGHHRTVMCATPSGEVIAAITGDEFGGFLWPNDLAFGPDGDLYLTDSGVEDSLFAGVSIRGGWRAAHYDGRVFQIDVGKKKVVRRLDSGIKFTNGIAFGPDQALYANETYGGNIYRYELFGPGASARRETFANVLDMDASEELTLSGWRGPDGMAFGDDGRLYCTVYGQGDVTVLGSNGEVVERIRTKGALPTNCAFAKEGQELVVTEVQHGELQAYPVSCQGLPLFAP